MLAKSAPENPEVPLARILGSTSDVTSKATAEDLKNKKSMTFAGGDSMHVVLKYLNSTPNIGQWDRNDPIKTTWPHQRPG